MGVSAVAVIVAGIYWKYPRATPDEVRAGVEKAAGKDGVNILEANPKEVVDAASKIAPKKAAESSSWMTSLFGTRKVSPKKAAEEERLAKQKSDLIQKGLIAKAKPLKEEQERKEKEAAMQAEERVAKEKADALARLKHEEEEVRRKERADAIQRALDEAQEKIRIEKEREQAAREKAEASKKKIEEAQAEVLERQGRYEMARKILPPSIVIYSKNNYQHDFLGNYSFFPKNKIYYKRISNQLEYHLKFTTSLWGTGNWQFYKMEGSKITMMGEIDDKDAWTPIDQLLKVGNETFYIKRGGF
jgi:hypothetical protein